MADEPVLIMKRRFLGRVLESGLLIIAVALGVGAAASGLSLFFHTKEYSGNLLASPEYREIVVTTRANVEDMEEPALEKNNKESVSLSTYDLKAGELIPSISWSYVTNSRRLRFMNEEFLNRGNRGSQGEPDRDSEQDAGGQDEPDRDSEQDAGGEEREPGGETGGDRGFPDNSSRIEDFTSAKDNPDYIIPEVDSLNGFEISSQFFNAWNLNAVYGSLFTSSDYSSNKKYLILGMGVAELLAGDDLEISELINKKIITWDSSYTVIGVLEAKGTDYDDLYFTPVRELSNNSHFRPRPWGDNQLLRFSVMNPEELNSTAQMLQDWFITAYGEGQVLVSNPRSEAKRVVSRNSGISFLILFLSLAGLFIAAVNVSNILMSRSLRMKKHIGILKALGASKNSISRLFIIEALVITGIGSLLGSALAVPLSIAMQKSLGLGDISWLYIGIGVILSSILTLTFSIIPARQYSGIEAAVAMRSAG